MMFTFIFFFTCVGLLFIAVFYLFNILLFRRKGATIFIRPKKGTAEYEKLTKLSSGLWIAYTFMLMITLALFIALSAASLMHSSAQDKVSTMVIGVIGVLILVSLLLGVAVSIPNPKKPQSNKKNNNKNTWVV